MLIENYNRSLQAIYDHVGFQEDWVILPIDDRRKYFWELSDDSIKYAEKESDFDTGDYYKDETYRKRFYEKHIYEGEKHTMIFVDTHTDGMKYFAIFQNDKRVL